MIEAHLEHSDPLHPALTDKKGKSAHAVTPQDAPKPSQHIVTFAHECHTSKPAHLWLEIYSMALLVCSR
jgi:hypothetical protein